MVKIALELDRALAAKRQHGLPGSATPRIIAGGDGWSVADVVCTSGPDDPSFEEQHDRYTVAVVVAGSFQLHSSPGRAVMTPGSLMLGNQGQCFECGHEHGDGDRCVSFWYAPDYFERVVGAVVGAGARRGFTSSRVPPLKEFAPLVALSTLGVGRPEEAAWEELSIGLAVAALTMVSGGAVDTRLPLNAEARVSHAVRRIERDPDAGMTLGNLAQEAGLSPYHFLRTFQRLTGVTPHQFVLRARLREAAIRLRAGCESVLDVAFDSGFGDVSNFNRAFRSEFGVSPRAFRRG